MVFYDEGRTLREVDGYFNAVTYLFTQKGGGIRLS